MKKIIMMMAMLSLTMSLYAQERELIKTCNTLITFPGQAATADSTFKIFKQADSFIAAVEQVNSLGERTSYEDIAAVGEFSVRKDLTSDLEQEYENLNLAESLVTQALYLTEEPVLAGFFSAGLDLRKIRSAKVYVIGKPADMGMTAIIEAKDEAGKDLGSFFGGFIVSACK